MLSVLVYVAVYTRWYIIHNSKMSIVDEHDAVFASLIIYLHWPFRQNYNQIAHTMNNNHGFVEYWILNIEYYSKMKCIHLLHYLHIKHSKTIGPSIFRFRCLIFFFFFFFLILFSHFISFQFKQYKYAMLSIWIQNEQ